MTDDDRDRCECCNMIISRIRGACPNCGCCDMCCDCKLPDCPSDQAAFTNKDESRIPARARKAGIEVREIGDAKGGTDG